MSLYDEVKLSDEVKMHPTMAVADTVMTELIGEGIYVEDGAIYIPIRLWEGIQNAQRDS